MSEQIEHPKIIVSYHKLYNTIFNPSFFQSRITHTAGAYFPYDDVIVLSYGDFFKTLTKRFNRTLLEQTCCTLSHEILHHILFKEQNIKVCAAFDNIASSLVEFGVY